MKSIIEYIQDDDPSFDPLSQALTESNVNRDLWTAACDRVFTDGYYGPISNEEWKEQDGREPYSVKDAIEVLKKVLDKVDDYRDEDRSVIADAHEIKKALVPFWREIYGSSYPS